MDKTPNTKRYDLEERTFEFARACREFVKAQPKSVQTLEDGKQLIRSSGSIAANYIEANESLSKKDFILRVKIAKKEAKESRLWLRLMNSNEALLNEATELLKILASILEKSK